MIIGLLAIGVAIIGTLHEYVINPERYKQGDFPSKRGVRIIQTVSVVLGGILLILLDWKC
jgi:hypothetical protein